MDKNGVYTMYEKNLTEYFPLRLSSKDMDFLRDLSRKRSISISECVRGIIGDYRRSFDVPYSSATSEKEACMFYGNSKTYFDNKLQF